MAKKEEQKARIPSAVKRWRQSEQRRLRNKSFTSKTKTAIKAFDALVAEGNVDGAKEKLNGVYSLLDKGHKKGIFKGNTANRMKSRISARLISSAA